MAEFSARYFYRAPLMSNFLSAEVVIYNIFLDISCNVYTLYSTLFTIPQRPTSSLSTPSVSRQPWANVRKICDGNRPLLLPCIRQNRSCNSPGAKAQCTHFRRVFRRRNHPASRGLCRMNNQPALIASIHCIINIYAVAVNYTTSPSASCAAPSVG